MMKGGMSWIKEGSEQEEPQLWGSNLQLLFEWPCRYSFV